jgi:ABC-type glycerol-3-phosphate transport system substrate-binding protein
MKCTSRFFGILSLMFILLIAAPAVWAGGNQAAPSTDRIVNMVTISLGPVPPGLQAIEDAVNAIIKPAINVKVKYTAIEVGSYPDQLNLMT